MSTNQKNKEHSYSINNQKYRDSATEKKAMNWGAAQDRAEQETKTVEFIKSKTDLPFVAFEQGFAAGQKGFVKGLPSDEGIEPALADIRLERVHQNHPTHVHIEVTGSDFKMRPYHDINIKMEKLKQQARTDDDKLFVCAYPNYTDKDGKTESKTFYVRIPTKDLKPGGALDISGTAEELKQRYPQDKSGAEGCSTTMSKGQFMLTLPQKSKYIISADEFIKHIEGSLNRAHYDRLTPEQKEADKAFHDKLDKDEPTKKALNKEYIKERGAITLKDGIVGTVTGLDALKLRKIAVMNKPNIVKDYREAVGNFPKAKQSQGLER